MRRRLAALLLVLAAVFGISLSAPQPATADGIIGNGVQVVCELAPGGSAMNVIVKLAGKGDLCDKIGDAVNNKVEEEWDKVWKSTLGDVIKSAEDVARWIIRKTLTVALSGPSLDLEATGLFGKDATLAGMMTWLGLVIAAAGLMWQIAKMAVTGQAKHAGRAAVGWVENILLSALGVGLFALLLSLGDALTDGLVAAIFKDDAKGFDRILDVMVPQGVANPIMVAGIVFSLCVLGFIQMIMVFLRQSAIPIICLLLPVAGGGRAGGDTTRQWAPRLITSGLVIIAYKPILAIIICTGFAELGESKTLAEWLRGAATLVLAVVAPGPLTKLFAPFGAAVGGGMAAGGASGALGAAADFIGSSGKSESGGGEAPTSPTAHAAMVNQTMGSQNGNAGEDGAPGADAQAQAARNEAAKIPAQATAEGAGVGEAATTAGAANATGTAAAAGPAGLAVVAAIKVRDGINDVAGEVGGGNQQ
ncbi:hypothetical protein NRK68_34070 (plasmid) [Streptomyces yangpuensis]|uniref:TrbL/VirB6 plasmid conjugal transfer protein n=1 Tax=Streptomyces yangpuensis TaxID=1648182 RepID=A0ABY5Q9I2_9ACTN|nr:hypothetical protein [Streptomyces yangpuensis]UUY52308.1 hypothetical protein NRK68_34070 [Streptomyces yangpuensis]